MLPVWLTERELLFEYVLLGFVQGMLNEGELPSEHGMQHYAQAPHISLQAIWDLLYNFWGAIGQCAALISSDFALENHF